MTTETWLAFFAASWLISLSPGAGAVYAMTCGLNHGFRLGYAGTLGLIAGIWTALAVASAGLGALLAASATAFEVVRWMGVAYLVWIGVQQWRASVAPVEARREVDPVPARTLIARGWALNATNPKAVLFMLAVVPPFVDPAAALLPQYLAIAATLAFTDLVVMAGYTAFAARVLRLLRDPAHLRWMNRAFGAMFIGVAALLAAFKRSG
jgi:homoserine/homoserine lactone efflux protein